MVNTNRNLGVCYGFSNPELNIFFSDEGVFRKQFLHKLLISRLLNPEV